MGVKCDFSGYATKANIKCSDGRTILKDAFKDCDGKTVPLVWQHMHNQPENILGHAVLENREDGVYAFCTFNDTPSGTNAKTLVKHGDITALSIFANQLKEQASRVMHGVIREVSLVLAGANKEAYIDNVVLQHADGDEIVDNTEAIIFCGDMELAHAAAEDESDDETETVQDVFDTLNEKQKNVVYSIIADALAQGEEEKEGDLKHEEDGGTSVKKNVFEGAETETKNVLTHEQIGAIFADAVKCGSLKEAILSHAGTYGIDDIEILFPDAKNLTNTPDFISRRMEWVSSVISGTSHTPFSRIKTMTADITVDTARALGYTKGALKKEEVFGLMSRVTTPTTIYKKQKLDREDILDITSFDVVAWLKAEMRVMLDEEIARAILLGDGRNAADPDKIADGSVSGVGIRPIYKEEALYALHIPVAANANTADMIETILRAKTQYKGSGAPTFFTTAEKHIDMLLVKDTMGRRLYNSDSELATALGVSRIVDVEVMEGVTNATNGDLIGIIVNLRDYNVGADRGGQITMFDDFDIDYNQYKYLMETRISGALTKPFSALIIEQPAVSG